MAFTDLREFVARLEQQGRLRRIGAPVSRDLEITEIVDRVSKSPGAANVALLFERVDGSDLPCSSTPSAPRIAWRWRSASSGSTSWASAWPSCSTRDCPAPSASACASWAR